MRYTCGPPILWLCPTLPFSNDSLRGKSVFGLVPVTSSSCLRPPPHPVLKASAAPNAPLSVSTAEHARLCGFTPPRGLSHLSPLPAPRAHAMPLLRILQQMHPALMGRERELSFNANGRTATMVQKSPKKSAGTCTVLQTDTNLFSPFLFDPLDVIPRFEGVVTAMTMVVPQALRNYCCRIMGILI